MLNKRFTNKIICSDSLSLLKEVPDNCVDLIFTSPPYNFGMDYDSIDDSRTSKDYFDFLFSILSECIRVLRPEGRIAINVQPLYKQHIPTHHIISNYLLEQGLTWKAEIVWEKSNYNCSYTTWGSYQSPSSPYFKYSWEFIEVFCKGSTKKTGKKEHIDISGESFKEWVYAKWTIAPEHRMKKYDHPAMFPEELAYRVLQMFSYQKDFILDPFCGTGTTCVAAKKTNRSYLGIDISKAYCETAKDRLHSILI